MFLRFDAPHFSAESHAASKLVETRDHGRCTCGVGHADAWADAETVAVEADQHPPVLIRARFEQVQCRYWYVSRCSIYTNSCLKPPAPL
jgi:hypothetical protein